MTQQSGSPRFLHAGPLARLLILTGTLFGLVIQYPPALCTRPLDIDETVTHWVIDARSPGGFWQRSSQYSATPPGYFVLLKASLQLFPATEFGYRALSLVCHLGLSVLVGLWVCRRSGASAGFAAALLVASHPLLRSQAVMARPYLPGVLGAWIGFTTSWKIATRTATRASWATWLIANACVLWSHYVFALALIPQTAVLLWGIVRRQTPIATCLGSLLGLVGVTLPLAPALMRLWLRRQYLNWSAAPAPWSGLAVLAAPWSSFTKDPLQVAGAFVATSTVLVLLVQSVRCIAGRNLSDQTWRTGLACIALGLVPPAVLWGIGHTGLPSLATSRYTAPMIPLMSAGVALLLGCLLPVRLVPLAAIAFYLAQGGTQFAQHWLPKGDSGKSRAPWHDPDRWTSAGWREASRALRHCSSADYAIVNSGLAEQTLIPVFPTDQILHDYVTCRATRFYAGSAEPRRIAVPATWDAATAEYVLRRLRAAVEAARRQATHPPQIYLVSATDTDVLRARGAATLELLENAGWTVASHRRWHGVELYILQPRVSP